MLFSYTYLNFLVWGFFGFCIVIVECLFFVVIHFAIHIFLEIYVLYFCVEVKLFNILLLCMTSL